MLHCSTLIECQYEYCMGSIKIALRLQNTFSNIAEHKKNSRPNLCNLKDSKSFAYATFTTGEQMISFSIIGCCGKFEKELSFAFSELLFEFSRF